MIKIKDSSWEKIAKDNIKELEINRRMLNSIGLFLIPLIIGCLYNFCSNLFSNQANVVLDFIGIIILSILILLVIYLLDKTDSKFRSISDHYEEKTKLELPKELVALYKKNTKKIIRINIISLVISSVIAILIIAL